MNMLDTMLGAQGEDATQQLGRQFGLNETSACRRRHPRQGRVQEAIRYSTC